ncbi:FtsQ-type POTRA domain-containing protein [Rhodobacterales bacterium HKCCE3408]|nr:FtsQ-type POTRA domain-containing protein [Rhodobacterales bacterium HKCCE3408]
MRPLMGQRRGPVFRDPAPSRWAYRMERLWLTPVFRRLCRVGIPAAIVFGAIGIWASDEENLRAVTDQIAEIRREIEMRPEFQVEVIGIEGASHALADEIRLVLGVDLPVSSFDLDLDMLRNRILGLSAVREADLRIRGGGYLSVEVVERQPALVWQTRGGPVLIDETGTFVAALSDRPGAPSLPQIAGEGADIAAAEALELLAASEPIADRIRGLVRMGERRWDIVLTDDRRILLPAHAPHEALDRLLALHDAQDILNRDVLRVDMRNPDRLSVQLSPAAQAELRRIRDFEEQALGEDRG